MIHRHAYGGDSKRPHRYGSFSETSSRGQDYSGIGHHFQFSIIIHAALQTSDNCYSRHIS